MIVPSIVCVVQGDICEIELMVCDSRVGRL